MRGIYQIKNNVTGDLYIGSSKAIFTRWSTHTHDLEGQAHGNAKLQKAWNEYGVHAFSFSILQLVETGRNLYAVERGVIEKLQPTYNATITILSREEGQRRVHNSQPESLSDQIITEIDIALIRQSTIPIPSGSSITVITYDGKSHFVIRQICGLLGIAGAQEQYMVISKKSDLKDMVASFPVKTIKGTRDSWCIDVQGIEDWLMGIARRRIKRTSLADFPRLRHEIILAAISLQNQKAA